MPQPGSISKACAAWILDEAGKIVDVVRTDLIGYGNNERSQAILKRYLEELLQGFLQWGVLTTDQYESCKFKIDAENNPPSVIQSGIIQVEFIFVDDGRSQKVYMVEDETKAAGSTVSNPWALEVDLS